MAFQLSETVRPLRLCSQANKLTASFMDTGRRHTTPGSKTRDDLLLTAEAVASISAFLCLFSKAQFPQCDQRWPDDTCT